MRIVAESQPVPKSTYVHLAYVSAEPATTFLLSAGIVLGVVILMKAALAAWRSRRTKQRDPDPVTAKGPAEQDGSVSGRSQAMKGP